LPVIQALAHSLARRASLAPFIGAKPAMETPPFDLCQTW
jgi:hypothetical protein